MIRMFVTLVFVLSSAAMAQPANQASATASPSMALRQALSQVQNTMASLNIPRWRTSRGVKQTAQEDVDSIQQDISQTLPGLLVSADAVPESVPPSFTVYRNVDALYDVLLRVSEIANFVAPPDEADAIASSLQELETARARLGDAILRVSQQHEERIKQFEAAIQKAKTKAKTADAATVRETIIDDGPVKSYRSRRRTEKKTAERKHEEKPAAGTPQ